VKVRVKKLNQGRETSALEQQLVEEALRIVAKKASDEGEGLPRKLQAGQLEIKMPIPLWRVQAGYVTQEFAIRTLADEIWRSLCKSVGKVAKKDAVKQLFTERGYMSMAHAVEILASREIASGDYDVLAQESRGLSARAARFKAAAEAAEPEKVEAALEELRRTRMSKSGTVRGTHGGADGMGQEQTASQAEVNWRATEEWVQKLVEAKEPLSLERIAQINGMLGFRLQNNGGEAGVYRNEVSAPHGLSAGGNFLKTYVESDLVAESLQRFIEWYHSAAQSGMEPVELAASAYQRLVSIHPFMDANGRTCRMVMDWILMAKGLPAATLEDVNVAVFGSALVMQNEKFLVSEKKAIEAVAQGVRNSLDALERSLA
jgi:prophage maintenance system killer protein